MPRVVPYFLRQPLHNLTVEIDKNFNKTINLLFDLTYGTKFNLTCNTRDLYSIFINLHHFIVRGDERWVAARGVIRDSRGNWIVGFQRYVGCESALVAELWGMLHGLQVARLKGHSRVIVESDYLEAVK